MGPHIRRLMKRGQFIYQLHPTIPHGACIQSYPHHGIYGLIIFSTSSMKNGIAASTKYPVQLGLRWARADHIPPLKREWWDCGRRLLRSPGWWHSHSSRLQLATFVRHVVEVKCEIYHISFYYTELTDTHTHTICNIWLFKLWCGWVCVSMLIMIYQVLRGIQYLELALKEVCTSRCLVLLNIC